ncbi:recombinase XerD [Microbacterium sp. 77mftsu3.1]|uniref:recombinase XerD n=1 Tax=Microbacterium sp. 77mftsu3.1 TaxID=1761802 RepID=UPI00115FB609|nr:recombinase XerD [Microbacterium sp. 77mftsu3.1]
MERPASTLTWLRSAKVKALLRWLAENPEPVTHAALDALPQSPAVRHLRSLLTGTGVLGHRDESLTRFEVWVRAKVALFAGEHRRAIERYAIWYHLRRVRQLSSLGQDTHPAVHNAKQQVTAAVNFLVWLQERHVPLAHCEQTDVDTWLTEGNTSRYTVRGFLEFTREARIAPPLFVPTRHARARTRRITSEERLARIRYYLTDESLTLSARSVALLLLLYGQPLSRVAAMRLDAIRDSPEEGMSITFSDDPVPVPPPFDDVLRRHIVSRARTRTVSVSANPFLFPGLRASSHISREQLKAELNMAGVDVLAAKNTSLDELVAAMPAPVVADALGYSYGALSKHEEYGGLRYRRYVHGMHPGDGADES